MSPITLAMTGASGAPYGLRLLQCLIESGKQVYLMISTPGQIVVSMESDIQLSGRPAEVQRVLAERFGAKAGQLQVFGREEWTAPAASGSSVPRAMVICPCTMGLWDRLLPGSVLT
jgi:4-hydroxy-3-polyprenylbenzoate decarboxylase